MSIINDLTEEERNEFAQHGVAFDAPAAGVEEPAAAQPEAAAPEAAPKPNAPARAADGKFVPAAEAKAAPTAEELAAAEAARGGDTNKMVPHAAMHAERMRANDVSRQLSIMTTRMNALLQREREAGLQVAPLPDLATDPAAYVQELGERQQASEEQRAQDNYHRQVDSGIEQDEQQFTSFTPDYPVAMEHFVNARKTELEMFYPPEQAGQRMLDEVRQIAQASWEKGVPFAESIYKLAQTRGYQKPAGQEQGGPPPLVPVRQAAPQQQRQAAPAPQAQVDAIRQGQAVSRSLSPGQGGANVDDINAEALVKMSDEEFARHFGIGGKHATERFKAVGGS